MIDAPPVIDISRGAGGVPLDDLTRLDSNESLVKSALKAFQNRFILADEANTVTAAGGQFPNLDTLRIDISNSNVRKGYRPSQYRPSPKIEPGITVGRFEYVAWPLLYQHGATRWRMSANKAQFSLLSDGPNPKAQQPPSTQPNPHHTLALMDVSDGSFDFSVKLADIRPMLMGSSSENSSKTFMLRDADVQFDSENPRSLSATMKISAFVLFVPTTFRLHARGDIDQWCNVHFSELSCQGLDPGGVLLAAFVNPSLQNYNGKVQPLMRWPGDRIVLEDVQIHIDDSLNVSATFIHNPDKR